MIHKIPLQWVDDICVFLRGLQDYANVDNDLVINNEYHLDDFLIM